MKGRFAFINVWRPITKEPVQCKPLALCDAYSVDPKTFLNYELRYKERTGLNYSLEPSDGHKWYYFPRIEKDECILFYVYDKKEDGPRFVFHTAFDDPTSEVGAPDRESIEIRAIVCFEEPEQKAVFYDNGDLRSATIKLWIKLKGIGHLVDIKAAKKCSFKTEKGNQLTDTNIIMQYLEDKYG